MKKKSSEDKRIIILAVIVLFAFIVLATCAVIKRIRAKQIEEEGGEYTVSFDYDKSVTDSEREFINSKVGNTHATQEVTVNVTAETLKYQLPEEGEPGKDYVIYQASVPVTDFYDGTIDVSSGNAGNYDFVSVQDITPDKRVLSIDGLYYLDAFTAGAEFRILHFTSEQDNEIAELVSMQVHSETGLPTMQAHTLSLAQTGVTALTRAMTLTLNGAAKGDGAYFAERIKGFLSAKDLTHISNESSFIDGCPGGTGTMSLCSDWRSMGSIEAIGTDIVELTGNHNNNYGYDANLNSIEKYHSLGMTTYGGGANAEAASKPIRIWDDALPVTETESSEDKDTLYSLIDNEKRAKITMLAYNNSTSTYGNGELATADHPGANAYIESRVEADINAAKQRGDFVIVDIQFFECYCYPDSFVEYPVCDKPIANQQNFFRHLIDLGADMVIGTQAHQPQTFEIYNDKPIYYGLGNLFFDQTYWPDTEKGLILTHYFVEGKYVQTRINPTIYDKAHQVELMDSEASGKYLNRLITSSPKGA